MLYVDCGYICLIEILPANLFFLSYLLFLHFYLLFVLSFSATHTRIYRHTSFIQKSFLSCFLLVNMLFLLFVYLANFLNIVCVCGGDVSQVSHGNICPTKKKMIGRRIKENKGYVVDGIEKGTHMVILFWIMKRWRS